MECMLQRVRKGTMFHYHGVLWINSVSYAEKRWRKWNENAKQTVICMMLRLFNLVPRAFPFFKGKALGMRLEVVDVDTTRKQLKIYFVGFSHEFAPRRSLK